MTHKMILGLLIFMLSHWVCAETPDENQAAQNEYLAWAKGIWDSLDRQKGEITLTEANAKLTVPEAFYFLNAQDASKVLVDVWGNPPGQEVLGMLLPEEMTPFDQDSWAVTIQYEEEGYVSDEDADDINYNELLAEMQTEAQEANQQRLAEGYESIELVGWAAPPYYDAASHKLYWAKELKFGAQETNTLNYNIRILGRKGVLVLNFIAGMDQKPVIDSKLDTVLALADFDQGASYADFNPDIDTVAAYGLGALITGKVIAKTGFMAAAIIFLKKFGVIALLGIGAFVKGIFGRKKKT